MSNHQHMEKPDQIRRKLPENTVGLLLCVLFAAVAFAAVVACLEASELVYKKWLFIVPAGYAAISLLFFRNFQCVESNIPQLLVQMLFFVRLAVLPLLYALNGMEKVFEGEKTIDLYFTKACLLMVYEYFAVQLTLWVIPRVKRSIIRTSATVVSRIDLGSKIIALMTVFLLAVSVLAPQYGIHFKSVLQLNEADFTTAERYEYTLGTMGRIVHTLFSLCLQLVRVLLPALIMQYFHKRKPGGIGVTLVLILGCVLQFFFLTATFAEAIVASIVLILYYMNLYPERAGKAMFMLLLGSVGMMLVFFTVRFAVKSDTGLYSGRNPLTHAAAIINAYFTGIDNVSASLNVPGGMRVGAFKADVLGAIPFNTTLFGDIGRKFQYYFNLFNSSYGQIPPTIGTGYYYLGALLSPLFSVLFIVISQWFYRAAQKNGNSLNFVSMMFCSIVFALGTVMYSFAIALQWFFSWGLLMIIITKLTATRNAQR